MMGEHIPPPPLQPLPGHYRVPLHHDQPFYDPDPFILEERVPRRRSHRHGHDPYMDYPVVEQMIHGMDHPKDEKHDKKKDEETPWPVPLEKPGAIVEYESWGFRKIGETWGKADRFRLEVPRAQLEGLVKTQLKAGGQDSIYEQMSKMNNLRAEQINRLVRSRQDATKNPHYEWQCGHIASKKGSKNKDGKREYPAMDVTLVKVVRKPEEFATEPPPSGPVLAGELIDLSKPEKEKKKDKKKKKGDEDPAVVFDDPAMLGGDPYGFHEIGGHPAGGHPQEPDPIEVIEDPHGHHHHHQHHQPHHYHEDPMFGEHPPRAPSVPRRRSRSRHRHRASVAQVEPLLVETQAQPMDSSLDDAESVWFGGDDRSSRTTHSGIDFMKQTLPPRRGSLKRDNGEHRKAYREHRRQDSHGRYSDEAVETYPERSWHRPEMERRRTLSYYPPRGTEIVQYDDPHTPTHRSYSPPPSVDRYEQYSLDELMREMDLLNREDHVSRKERQLEREEERRRRELINEIERRKGGRRDRGYYR